MNDKTNNLSAADKKLLEHDDQAVGGTSFPGLAPSEKAQSVNSVNSVPSSTNAGFGLVKEGGSNQKNKKQPLSLSLSPKRSWISTTAPTPSNAVEQINRRVIRFITYMCFMTCFLFFEFKNFCISIYIFKLLWTKRLALSVVHFHVNFFN